MDAASGSGFESDAKHSSSAAAKQSTRALDVVSGPRVQASYRRLARSGSASRAAGHPELNVDYKCSPPLQEDPRSTGRTVADSVSQQSTALSSAAAAAPGPTGYRGLLTLMHARMTRKQRAQPISRAEIAALLSHELGRLDWTDLLGHLQADDEQFEVQIATKRFEHAAQALSELADAATASSTGGAAAVPASDKSPARLTALDAVAIDVALFPTGPSAMESVLDGNATATGAAAARLRTAAAALLAQSAVADARAYGKTPALELWSLDAVREKACLPPVPRLVTGATDVGSARIPATGRGQRFDLRTVLPFCGAVADALRVVAAVIKTCLPVEGSDTVVEALQMLFRVTQPELGSQSRLPPLFATAALCAAVRSVQMLAQMLSITKLLVRDVATVADGAVASAAASAARTALEAPWMFAGAFNALVARIADAKDAGAAGGVSGASRSPDGGDALFTSVLSHLAEARMPAAAARFKKKTDDTFGACTDVVFLTRKLVADAAKLVLRAAGDPTAVALATAFIGVAAGTASAQPAASDLPSYRQVVAGCSGIDLFAADCTLWSVSSSSTAPVEAAASGAESSSSAGVMCASLTMRWLGNNTADGPWAADTLPTRLSALRPDGVVVEGVEAVDQQPVARAVVAGSESASASFAGDGAAALAASGPAESRDTSDDEAMGGGASDARPSVSGHKRLRTQISGSGGTVSPRVSAAVLGSPRRVAVGPVGEAAGASSSSSAAAAAAPSTDDDDNVICSVCRFDVEDDDPLVICDGCNLPVHQTCYGIADIPAGEWLCDPCAAGIDPAADLPCAFCPRPRGAMKPTAGGHWAHMSCALFIPCVAFQDAERKDVAYVVGKDDERLADDDLDCYVHVCECCDSCDGATAPCRARNCSKHIHPSCGADADAFLGVDVRRNRSGREYAEFFVYCPHHAALKADVDANSSARSELGLHARMPSKTINTRLTSSLITASGEAGRAPTTAASPAFDKPYDHETVWPFTKQGSKLLVLWPLGSAGTRQRAQSARPVHARRGAAARAPAAAADGTGAGAAAAAGATDGADAGDWVECIAVHTDKTTKLTTVRYLQFDDVIEKLPLVAEATPAWVRLVEAAAPKGIKRKSGADASAAGRSRGSSATAAPDAVVAAGASGGAAASASGRASPLLSTAALIADLPSTSAPADDGSAASAGKAAAPAAARRLATNPSWDAFHRSRKHVLELIVESRGALLTEAHVHELRRLLKSAQSYLDSALLEGDSAWVARWQAAIAMLERDAVVGKPKMALGLIAVAAEL